MRAGQVWELHVRPFTVIVVLLERTAQDNINRSWPIALTLWSTNEDAFPTGGVNPWNPLWFEDVVDSKKIA